MATNLYPCSQDDLYTAADTAWNLYLLNIGDFASFSKSYTTRLFEIRTKEIQRAKEIITIKELNRKQSALKKQLISAKKDVLHHYKCMTEFVKMNKTEHIIPLLNVKKTYRKATNNDWNACKHIAYASYITTKEHFEFLIQGDNMPPAFAEECEKVREKYDQLYSRYHLFKHEILAKVCRKVTDNNSIYDNLGQMLRHAQLIYRNRADMQQLFQFDKLLKTARKKKKNEKTAEAKPAVLSFLNKVAAMF
jgi:hypothetical protein